MKLAMSNIAWASEERLSAYQILADAGFTGLEIAPGLFFRAADDPFAPDAAIAREAIAEAADAGLELVSMQSLLFGVAGAALFEGDEARSRFEAGMICAINLAGRFGIPNLVFGSPTQRRVPAELGMDEAIVQAADLFRSLGERAQSAGTRIAIEPNPAAYGTNFLNTLDEAARFARRVDHCAVSVNFDLGAMLMNESIDTATAAIPALGMMLSHVHVSEPHLAPAPAARRDLLPVLEALGTADYSGAVSIEMKRSERGLADVSEGAGRLAAAAAQQELCDG